MKTPRLLAIHDMCSFGRCSLTAVMPVLSAMGIQVCPFPTALFSNNLTYSNIDFYDFTPHMTKFMDIWEKNGYEYDAVYSGFLASSEQIHIVEEAIRRFGKKSPLIICDPAMADNGNLYPVFTPDIVPAMRRLTSHATVITPNYTEACLLLDRPYEERIPTTKELTNWCQELAELGPEKVVITSIPANHAEIKNVSYDKSTLSYDEYTTPLIPFTTCGTGDLFTSVLTGFLLNGTTLHDSIGKATRFMAYCIKETYEAKSDPREGVQIERCLTHLMTIDKL